MSELDLLGQLEANFNRREVGITEFAESKEFCGRILYPRQRLLLKLFFLEDLTEEEERILDLWIAEVVRAKKLKFALISASVSNGAKIILIKLFTVKEITLLLLQ
jgi:hypothetical protein